MGYPSACRPLAAKLDLVLTECSCTASDGSWPIPLSQSASAFQLREENTRCTNKQLIGRPWKLQKQGGVSPRLPGDVRKTFNEILLHSHLRGALSGASEVSLRGQSGRYTPYQGTCSVGPPSPRLSTQRATGFCLWRAVWNEEPAVGPPAHEPRSPAPASGPPGHSHAGAHQVGSLPSWGPGLPAAHLDEPLLQHLMLPLQGLELFLGDFQTCFCTLERDGGGDTKHSGFRLPGNRGPWKMSRPKIITRKNGLKGARGSAPVGGWWGCLSPSTWTPVTKGSQTPSALRVKPCSGPQETSC